MKPAQIARNLAQGAFEPLETLGSQAVKPMWNEAMNELGGFFGIGKPGGNQKELAKEDLQRARDKQKLEEMDNQDEKSSKEKAQKFASVLQQEYRRYETTESKKQKQLKEEVLELQSEVVKLARTAGIDTKAHLEQMPRKIGVLDIKRLTSIVRFLRIKANEAKSAKELVQQRANAKPATGMLAWVSGKQMKVHEQGTLQLQG